MVCFCTIPRRFCTIGGQRYRYRKAFLHYREATLQVSEDVSTLSDSNSAGIGRHFCTIGEQLCRYRRAFLHYREATLQVSEDVSTLSDSNSASIGGRFCIKRIMLCVGTQSIILILLFIYLLLGQRSQ